MGMVDTIVSAKVVLMKNECLDEIRTCSCGETFETEQIFLKKTQSIGFMSTFEYLGEDLELRNCMNCLTTLTRGITRNEELVPA